MRGASDGLGRLVPVERFEIHARFPAVTRFPFALHVLESRHAAPDTRRAEFRAAIAKDERAIAIVRRGIQDDSGPVEFIGNAPEFDAEGLDQVYEPIPVKGCGLLAHRLRAGACLAAGWDFMAIACCSA